MAANILGSLYAKLRGRGYRSVGSDMMLIVDAENGRYPDVGIYCDPRDFASIADPGTRGFRYPTVLFEVISPSTRYLDRGTKLAQYQGLATVDTVVLVDPEVMTCELFTRQGEWLSRLQRPGSDLNLRKPEVTLSADEVFG